jgi:hypothetical protein
MAEWKTWRNAVGWLLSGGALALIGNGSIGTNQDPSYYRGSHGGYFDAPGEDPAFGYDPRYDRRSFYQAGYEPSGVGGGVLDWIWSRVAATRDVFNSRSSASYASNGYQYPPQAHYPQQPEHYGVPRYGYQQRPYPQNPYRPRSSYPNPQMGAAPHISGEVAAYGYAPREQGWSQAEPRAGWESRARYDTEGARGYRRSDPNLERQQELAATEYETLGETEMPWQRTAKKQVKVSKPAAVTPKVTSSPSVRSQSTSRSSLVPPPKGIEPRIWGADDSAALAAEPIGETGEESADEMTSDDREALGDLLESTIQ